MKIEIIAPQNLFLQNFVQYFLFFRKNSDSKINYTTFPNSNFCLAIYKNNNVEYKKSDDSNICKIRKGNSEFASRLFGSHKTPFKVNIESPLDQISILFRPTALRQFTKESYKNLMNSDNVFDNVFRSKQSVFLENLFTEKNSYRRAAILEKFLLERLENRNIPEKIKEILRIISLTEIENLSVEKISKSSGINESTLYRLFSENLGQNPKTFLKTIRFRKALNKILKNKQTNFTDVTYSYNFFDQSHFIKDFKTFTGYSPKKFHKVVSINQNELIWIHQKN